jgi:hypothetical protein
MTGERKNRQELLQEKKRKHQGTTFAMHFGGTVTKDGNPETHVHEMMENQKGNDQKERHEGMYSERIDMARRAGITREE